MTRPAALALFEGKDSNGKSVMWVTNGATAGTYELMGGPGADAKKGYQPTDITEFDGQIFFNGVNAHDADTLWVSDGTAGGTHQVTGIAGTSPQRAGAYVGLNPYDMTTFDNEVLFDGSDSPTGLQALWVSDGTAAGTHEVQGIAGVGSKQAGNYYGLEPSDMTVFNDEVLFRGADFPSGQQQLWVTDGTAADTHEVQGIAGANTGMRGLDPAYITVFGNEALFNGIDSNRSSGLWVTDGTGAGTHELTGIVGVNGGGMGNPSDMTVFDGEVLFRAINTQTNMQNLWVTDGTAAGTHELHTSVGFSRVFGTGLDPSDLTVFNGEVLFAGANHKPGDGGLGNGPGEGLWVTDGTAAGTQELTGIAGVSRQGLNPTDLTVVGNRVFFSGDDSSGNTGLWVTNGTAQGTHEISVVGESTQLYGFNPQHIVAVSSLHLTP
jgi:ELWxxDGT repeat protein